ncbi:MAG: YhdP family protein [Legionella sp.]|nr:YhdP family protein [Legionella sp.]
MTKKAIKCIQIPVWLKRWIKRVWVLAATLVVLFAISLTVFRALTPWAAQYKGAVETQLSRLLGTDVSIQEMKTSWYWFEPVLKLDGVKFSEKNYALLDVGELLVGIDLMRSFWHWRIQPGVLFVEDATFNLREDNTHWQLDGVALNADLKTAPQAEYSTVLGWFLAHQKIVMKRVGLKLHWKDGRVTAINPLNLNALNHDGHYRVKGQASLVGEKPSVLSLLADLTLPSGFSSNVRGHVYLSAERIHFSEWHTFFSNLGFEVTEGLGEGQLWLDIDNSHLVSAQSVLRVRDIILKDLDNKTTRTINRLSANMAFEETPDGWRWTADHVRFQANKTTWPENALTLTYQADNAQYKLFIKTLLLEPTHLLLQNTPKALKPIFEMKPRGQLNNTQFGFKAGKLNYILTRFSHLSWEATETRPAVTHISGALAFEPKEGHLELDGEEVTLGFKNKPPLHADILSASLTWKALAHGWRVNLDRGILKHPKGLFSARGTLNDYAADTGAHLDGNISFATHDATFWWPYLPEKGLKPKFKAWLEHDVTRIEQLSGRVQLKGPLKAFPFDNQAGLFLMTASVSGVDFRFNPDWPLTTDISGTFRLDKRLLTGDVTEANFQGVPMQKGHFEVPDLGLNHEVLSVEAESDAPLEDMQKYIKNSPLHKKLSKLDALIFKQPANLNLKLRFPFYPGGEKFALNGRIDFQNNDLFLQDVPQAFGLHDVSGELKFHEQGVLDTHLTARLFDEPMALWVRSNHGDTPHLAIDMTGYLSALGLRETVSLPALALVRGRSEIKTEVIITDEPNDLDHVHLTSSLEGIDIDLPAPFGKQREEAVPLIMDTYFNLERGMRLKINCDKRLSTDLWFAGRSSALALERGEVVLGTGKAVLRDKPGAVIQGKFKAFDGASWIAALDKLKLNHANTSKDYLSGFRAVSLDFETAELLNQHYQNVQFYAQRLPDNVWSLVMKEETVSADLKYAPQQNKLSGSVSAWQLDKPNMNAVTQAEAKQSAWKPQQLPNLKLKVGALQVGDVNAGALALKGTHVSDTLWRLDSGELKSDAYALKAAGEWQETSKPETKIDARLQIADLDKALKHWHFSPAVEAHEGDIHLIGEWDGAPNDFSVKGFTGNMYIMFKEGRIPNLSPETEKKMALGKLLSILSLQTIPRRLKLDFSDLSKPGYSFDKFDGHFVLAHGIMQTEDSAIDGPVARATMKGSLNLDKQLYDLSLHVMPHITASLPVVATIAGGPIAGLATWVASKLINQSMEKISGYTYDVSGPWQEPVVQQVHIYKKPVS